MTALLCASQVSDPIKKKVFFQLRQSYRGVTRTSIKDLFNLYSS